MTGQPEIPRMACDCHMHVFGPRGAYPYDPGRSYTPPEATLGAYLEMRGRLRLERVVFIQPSVYGADNRCHLDAMARVSGSRGVAVISGSEPDGELERLHQCGVRGIRINLKQGMSRGPIDVLLERVCRRLSEVGWHLQINADIAAIQAMASFLVRSAVPVMFDHFAGLAPWAGPAQPGFETVRGLLRDGPGWMKLSAAYLYPRGDEASARAGARRFVSELVETVPARLVWGSNWPHPGLSPQTTAQEAPTAPFRKVDDDAMLGLLVEWLDDEALLKRVLSDNPSDFYGF